jgi:hypothetical protein
MRKLYLTMLVLFGAIALGYSQSAQLSYSNYCGKLGVANVIVPWYCSQINTQLGEYWSRWEPIAAIAIMVSFSIATILFAAGIALKNEKLRNFGVGEIYEAVATTIIVAMFMFVSMTMLGLLPGLIIGYPNPYYTSLNYLSLTIKSSSESIYNLFQVAVADRLYESMNLIIETPGFTMPPIKEPLAYAVMYLFYLPAWGLIDLQLDALIILYAEFYMILIFMYIAIPAFLVPGIVFRAILPTRSLGGMMISVAIGFYLVMPILFSVAYTFTSNAILTQLNQENAALNRYGGSASILNSASPTSPLVQTLGNIQQNMGGYWLSVLFYPSLIIAMTYAVITQLSQFIGGMTRFSGRLRL